MTVRQPRYRKVVSDSKYQTIKTCSILPNITPGYNRGARNLKKDGRMKFDPTSEWTGGGLITNPTMLVQFFAALIEGRIVEPESFAQMLDAGWRNPVTF